MIQHQAGGNDQEIIGQVLPAGGGHRFGDGINGGGMFSNGGSSR